MKKDERKRIEGREEKERKEKDVAGLVFFMAFKKSKKMNLSPPFKGISE